MSAVKIVGTLIVGFFVVFVARVVYLLTPIWAKIQVSPWWIYAIIVGILISGYLSFRYAKDEKELDERWIEQEGETFMEPIRERRQNKKITNL
ncbi:sporulation YhaL family protein [Bacillaceae bacterium IKA-2]|nr:sporulation YhaL family protein [Bacillaceae bacterium IKA-2]